MRCRPCSLQLQGDVARSLVPHRAPRAASTVMRPELLQEAAPAQCELEHGTQPGEATSPGHAAVSLTLRDTERGLGGRAGHRRRPSPVVGSLCLSALGSRCP